MPTKKRPDKPKSGGWVFFDLLPDPPFLPFLDSLFVFLSDSPLLFAGVFCLLFQGFQGYPARVAKGKSQKEKVRKSKKARKGGSGLAFKGEAHTSKSLLKMFVGDL